MFAHDSELAFLPGFIFPDEYYSRALGGAEKPTVLRYLYILFSGSYRSYFRP